MKTKAKKAPKKLFTDGDKVRFSAWGEVIFARVLGNVWRESTTIVRVLSGKYEGSVVTVRGEYEKIVEIEGYDPTTGNTITKREVPESEIPWYKENNYMIWVTNDQP